MSLKDKIKEELNLALKSHQDLKRLVLSSLLAAIHNKEIEKRTTKAKKEKEISEKDLIKASELTDEEVISVIRGEVKKRKEAIELYQKGGREELAQKEKDELNILAQFLPEQISEEELRKIVKKVIIEVGAKEMKDLGRVIGAVMAKIKGQVQGSEVNKIAREEIEKLSQ